MRSLATRIVPLRFQAIGRRKRPNLGLVCLCLFYVIYFLVKDYGDTNSILVTYFGPCDHYFRSVCLFVCAEFFSAVFDPISIKLGHMLYVWV